MHPRLTAVVLTYNEHDLTSSLVDQLMEDNFVTNVVLADNSEDEGIKDLNRSSFSNKKNLYYLELSVNGGYAHGNNSGIKYAIQNLSPEFIWILNNDVILQDVSSNAMIQELSKDPKTICGSVLFYNNGSNLIDEKSKIQCYGGVNYYKLLGKAKLNYKGFQKLNAPPHFKNPDFIMGASVMVDSNIFKEVGFIPEEYFMYNEEIDWQIQAIKKGYKVRVAKDSELIHLDSLSTENKKGFYYYHLFRSNIMLTKKHFKLYLLPVMFFSLLSSLRVPSRYRRDAFKGFWHGL